MNTGKEPAISDSGEGIKHFAARSSDVEVDVAVAVEILPTIHQYALLQSVTRCAIGVAISLVGAFPFGKETILYVGSRFPFLCKISEICLLFAGHYENSLTSGNLLEFHGIPTNLCEHLGKNNNC